MSDNRHEELARRLLDQPPSQWPPEISTLRVEMKSMPLALRAKLDAMNQAAPAQKPVRLVQKTSFRIAASFGTAIAASVLVYFAFIANRGVSPATIVMTEGDVKRNSSPAIVGDRLRELDTLKVGNEAVAVIVAEHKGETEQVRVLSGTEIAIQSHQETLLEVRMKVGRLLATVPKKKDRTSPEFRISTPTSVASVRGTVFSVEKDSSVGTTLSTYEGAVEFRRRWDALEDLSPALIAKSEILSGSLAVFEKATANVESGMQSAVDDQDFKARLQQIEPLSTVLSGPTFVALRNKAKLSDEETSAALKALNDAFASAEARTEILQRVETAFGEPPKVETLSADDLKSRRESFEALSAGERQAKYNELRGKSLDREAFKREATRLMGKAPQEVILKNGETLYGTVFGENGRYRVYTATGDRVVSPEEVEEILFE